MNGLAKTRKLEMELPEEIIAYFGSIDEVELKMKQAAVLELLRRKKVSQGKAAELLEMNRWDFYQLMAEHNIPMVDLSSEELAEGATNLQRATGLR